MDQIENWKECYDQLLELSPALISIVIGGKIASINAAGLRLLGATEHAQLIGRPLLDLILPAHRNNVAERFQRIAEEAQLPVAEEKWVRLDGTVIDMEVTTAPFRVQEQLAVQLVAHDITRRKRAEEMLRESEERHRRLMELYLDLIGVETARTAELHAALRRAREVDGLKSQLLSTVSHELRTPLTVIRGQTSTLLDYSDQMTREEQIEALNMMDKEAARLDELIGHILDMSRLESGTLRVELVAIDLRPILQEVIDRVATQASHHILLADLAPELPLAQADPRRVRQVMYNLLDNAVKFSQQGSTITVNAQARASALVVSVCDEGTGIAPEHLPHIFEGFYRAEGPGTRGGGVGLGLAICKGLVETMGGSITVVSQLGRGSAFSFSLPLTQGVSDHDED